MPSLTGEPTGGWTLLRVKPNSAGAGTFADDTDFAGTNVAPPSVDIVNVPGQLSSTDHATQRISVMVVAVGAADVQIARGTYTCVVDFVEVARTQENEQDYAGLVTFVIDSVPLADVPLNRKVEVDLEKGQYTVRLTTFANIPAAALELRVYAKVS